MTTPRLRTQLLAALAAAFALLCLAQGAHAATLTVARAGAVDTLNEAASPGEANQVTVEQGATQVRLTDATAPVAPPATLPAGVACAADGPHTVTCSGIEAARLDLRDGDDGASVTGTLPVIMLGGAGNDDLTGGDGPDLIASGAGTSDVLAGGGGADRLDGSAARGV